ncbi:hypothetical protein TD95_000070 [Thielaviopsis punctulata]|uniref:Glycosyl hydrolase n=1 Tax=Thielaviopsis punctulata TaxID=72032 RepID=A0A0F4Z6S9_9PEZI|nr:hypothetical protein TD95_000070 [Thielaviopsis punctulata]
MRSLLIYVFLITVVALNVKNDHHTWIRTIRRKYVCSIFNSPHIPEDECWTTPPSTFLEEEPLVPVQAHHRADPGVLDNAFYALTVMQDEFFKSELGTWPSSIDWTAAVLQTLVSAMTSTLSEAFLDIDLAENSTKSNMIDLYFSQTVAAYFGQNHISIRGQAYDDMLWVVLGWLEALQFISKHSKAYYNHEKVGAAAIPEINDAFESQPWYGNYWARSFAHRARVFWELASKGWGTDLCGGGMNWNPHEWVYKNAITNELWIAASIQMYLHFPGDDITTPWKATPSGFQPVKDPKFLMAAVDGYKWLMNSNMTNSHGLFTDGFHISGRNGSTRCDQRNEMVFTYNQGVLLTGQRGLWSATGSPSYLNEGHALIQNVIRATGWSIKNSSPRDDVDDLPPGLLPPWRGLGRGGILEDVCDSSASCSQNGHTFKGIFFHHLTHFCKPLEVAELNVRSTRQSRGFNTQKFENIAAAHARACRSYVPWLKHNAEAALLTRDEKGVFGTWWSAGLLNLTNSVPRHGGITLTSAMVDYRNHPIERVNEWGNGSLPKMAIPGVDDTAIIESLESATTEGRLSDAASASTETSATESSLNQDSGLNHVVVHGQQQHVMNSGHDATKKKKKKKAKNSSSDFSKGDPNDRGRGRTVETHNGGMAILRAWWEVSRT